MVSKNLKTGKEVRHTVNGEGLTGDPRLTLSMEE